MIFPRNVLLLSFACIVVPCITLIGVVAHATPVALFIMTSFCAALILDILLSWQRPYHINIELPSLLRMTCYGDNHIPVHVTTTHPKTYAIRFGLTFPSGITSSHSERQFSLQNDSAGVKMDWPCLPWQRGQYRLKSCAYEVGSAMGFFSFRRRINPHCEIRVYPDLRNEYHRLAAFFLNRESGGVHSWKYIGKGREFEKLREYVHGDSFDDIHWKATAKRHRAITKVYQIERTQRVYIALDTSRLSNRTVTLQKKGELHTDYSKKNISTSEVTILERFISSALILASAAQRQGDLYGILTFSDRTESFVKASRGSSHYSLFRDTLYTVKNTTASPDYRDVMTHIRLKLRRRSLLIFLTSLDDPVLADEFVQTLDLISRQHLIIVGVIPQSPTQPLFSKRIEHIDQIYEHLENHIAWYDLSHVEKQLNMRGVRMLKLTVGDISSQIVSSYIKIKQRQLL